MSLETAIDRFIQLVLAQSRKPPRMIERHFGVIVSVDVSSQTCYARLDGRPNQVGPLQYSGSVAPPSAGESWAFDVVQRQWVAVYRLNVGSGRLPAYDVLGAAVGAQARAETHADFLLTASWSIPGILPSSTSLAACPPHILLGAVPSASKICLDIAVAVPDVSNVITWEFVYTPVAQQYANQTAAWTIAIPAGATSASIRLPCSGFGSPGDTILGYLVSYAGSTASGLGAHFRVR